MDTLTQDQINAMVGMSHATPDQHAQALSHSNGMLGTILSTGGAIAGGIGGAALGGLAGIETGPGALATGYLGGVAGSGAGAAAGEALAQKLEGQPIDTGDIAKTGAMAAGTEAVLGPVGSMIAKPLSKVASPIISGIGKGLGYVAEKFGAKPAAEAIPKVLETTGIKSTEDETLTKALTPTILKPTQKQAAIRAGKVSPASFATESGVDPLAAPEIAKSVQAVKNVANALGRDSTSIVKTGFGQAIRNANRLQGAIRNYSKDVVSPMLKDNPTPFNFEDLRKAFELVTPKISLDSPASVQTYNTVREKMLNVIANTIKKTGNVMSKDDFNDIWNARKAIDNTITDELGTKTFDSPEYKGVKAAAQDFRNAFKQYLTDSFKYSGNMEKLNQVNESIQAMRQRGIQVTEDMIPALQRQMGLKVDPAKEALSKEWEQHMENLSGLFDALDTVVPKASKEFGKTGYQLFKAEHPGLTRTVQWAGRGAAGAAGAGAVYEGGKTVLGE